MKSDQSKGKATASFVLGILGLVFVLVTGGPGILCGIVGLILGNKFEDGIGRVGRILSSLAIIIGIIVSIYFCTSTKKKPHITDSNSFFELQDDKSNYDSNYASGGASWQERD